MQKLLTLMTAIGLNLLNNIFVVPMAGNNIVFMKECVILDLDACFRLQIPTPC